MSLCDTARLRLSTFPSYEVHDGEIVAIIRCNGAGKSTLRVIGLLAHLRREPATP